MPEDNIKHIAQAVAYIEAHLTDKLDLSSIANAVHYSKYHLHRMFTGTVGMTPHDYLKRRQLTEAAKLLVFSERSVLDIALLTGYESQQAFTDVFTAMYKMPPSKYRENEKFYPLQLNFQFDGSFKMLKVKDETPRNIEFATEEDIPCWMDLVRLVIDGFPCLNEEEYRLVLKEKIRTNQALLLKDGAYAIGAMLFSRDTGSIDFMGCHPLYRKKGLPGAFLHKVMSEMLGRKEISITTYRDGDRADTGQRREIQALGFAEAELLTEFGYPTQRFVLKEEDNES